MRRPGHTYRIHDFYPRGRGPLVLAFDPESRGGVYSPAVRIHWRGGRGYIGGWSIHLRMPVIGWHRAYRWRRLGTLRLYLIEYRLIRRLFT